MEVFLEAGPFGWAQVIFAVGGLLWALVCVVLLGLRWKVPPVVATAPLLLHAVTVAAGATWLGRTANAGSVDPSMVAMSLAQGIDGMIANGTLGVIAVPAAMLLILGGTVAGVRGRRAFGAPAFVFIVAMGVAILPLVSIAYNGVLPLAIGRFVIYGAAALPLTAALAGAHPQDNSREGSVVAGIGFVSLVAAVELLTLSNGWAHGFQALAVTAPDQKATLVAMFVAEMGQLGTLSWAAVVLGAVPAAMALLRPPADLTEQEILEGNISPSALRWIGQALAFVVPLAWCVAMQAANPAEVLTAIAGPAVPTEAPAEP
ncbi:hypothetical protein LBMAG42_35910 [Deltaproteobacteria bacterium]|nr:hypothetical protein LBMAG42_35910 [Deltaproteobacteria bacterium]